MTYMRGIRVIAGVSGLLLAASALGGCVSSPTYGTGTTAGEQLMDDIGAAASIGSSKQRTAIKYTPRPGLVVPPGSEQAALEAPQASLADKSNGQWVESPEDTRARLLQEADDNAKNPNYHSPLSHNVDPAVPITKSQIEAFRAGRQDQKGTYEGRRYLSDPPNGYRQADPAVLQDLGEPEKEKEKRRRKAATIEGTGAKWWQPFQ